MAPPRIVSLPPWRRGPSLLLSQRGVVATVIVATAVVVAGIASLPVFLSSVGVRAISMQAADRCGPDTGASFTAPVAAAALTTERSNPFEQLGGRLGEPRRWLVVPGEGLSRANDVNGSDVGITLVWADDALAHIDALEGDPAAGGQNGWWITDRAAQRTGLAVGDQAMIGQTTATVTGIYRDLAGPELNDYWCAEARILLPVVSGGDITLPPPVVLVDVATAAQFLSDARANEFDVTWRASLGTDVTAEELPGLVDDLACGESNLVLRWCEADVPPSDGLGEELTDEPLTSDEADRFVRESLGSHLGYVVRRTNGIVATVAAGIVPIGASAAAAGLAMTAAAAALWHDRRKREIRLLLTRGMGPGSVAVKAVFEMSVPIVVGFGLGVVTSLVAPRWFGPSWQIESRSIAVGSGLAAMGFIAVVGVIATTAYLRARSLEGGAKRSASMRWVPWELPLVWVTVEAYRRLGQWGVPVSFRDESTEVDVWGLLFPVLFVVTSVLIARRILGLVLCLCRRRPLARTTALGLAVRRMYRARNSVLALLASAAVTAGVLGLAVTLQQSLSTTLDTKGLTFAGSDVVVRLGYAEPMPAVASSSAVTSPGDAQMIVSAKSEEITVYAIDPATFADAAFWDASLADRSLEAIMTELSEPRTDGVLSAVVVSADSVVPNGRTAMTIGDTQPVEVTIEPLDGVTAFPGMRRFGPTVFVSAPMLEQFEPTTSGTGTRDVWVRGDRELIVDRLDQAGAQYTEIRGPSMVADLLAFEAVSWTFDFVLAVGSVAGVLVFAGVAVYLDAAHRSRLLSYTFLRRMGLSRRTHQLAITIELIGTIVVGAALGLTMAWIAVRLAYRRIDPVPGYPPETVFRPATGLSVGVVAGCVIAVVVAAWLAQRRLDAEDPGEVLRAGI
jgi:putative ABC transport system permease protein